MNVLVIGWSTHFRKVYFGYIIELMMSKKIKNLFLVDLLRNKNNIRKFLFDHNIQNIRQYYLISEKSTDTITYLDRFILQINQKIDCAIISTEPRHRLEYYFWCIRNSINIFADKPLTAPNKKKHCVYKDYLIIE